MTERGLPSDAAPACPFVAFEDDRDGRSTAPDHRHRCFAETRPAPRALAHQEAYCLSSAFPVCPTFQDWARREAAAARPAPPSDLPLSEQPPQSRPMPPAEREPRRASLTDTPPPIPPRRAQHRDWAAPPPWLGDDPGAPGAGSADAAAGGAGASSALWGPDADVPGGGSLAPDRGPGRDAVPRADEWGSDARGLAGSAADRLAGPDPDEPRGAVPDPYDLDSSSDRVSPRVPASASHEDEARYAPPPRRPGRGSRPAAARRDARGEPRPDPRLSSRDQVRRPTAQDPQELFGPAWEAPRRYEAYPSLRTRIGLPGLGGIPKVAVWLVVLLLVAALLFLFGPSLLGLVADDGGAASPTPSATVVITPTPVPTEPPAPTPQVYIVAKGDTMSKIAKKFGLTVEEILAANPQIKNADKIGIGDEITIPLPTDENGFAPDDGTVVGESASP